ncbi:MAG: VCBS repeat-containing protein [Clostridia bacterium]|nr:VCBS repeat-containing protein [Clostridia bacterium]
MLKLKKILSFLLVLIIFTSTTISFAAPVFAADWVIRTSIPLAQSQSDYDFAFGDRNSDDIKDLFIFKMQHTDSDRVEIHTLNGHNGWQTFLDHIVTPLEAGNHFDFVLADYDRDGVLDIIAIKKYDTSSNKTEFHILNGADNFQSFLLQVAVPLSQAGENFDFAVTDYDRDGVVDIFAIKKRETGSGLTEVHVLNGATQYQDFLLQTSTILGAEAETFEFKIGDYNADGWSDLIAIKRYYTGTESTEIHILNGHNNFQTFLYQNGTPLSEAQNNFDFEIEDIDSDGILDFCAIKKYNTGSKNVEAHIMKIDGAQKIVSTAKKVQNYDTLTNALYGINVETSKITCGFDGYKKSYGYAEVIDHHEGIDFAYGFDKNVYSLTDGIVTRVEEENKDGMSTIAIYNTESNKTIVYLHTDPLNSLKVGDSVQRGDLIATEASRGVGNTHTHVEVRNGKQYGAANSIDDPTLDNENPTHFWESQGYSVK